jgi:hypothetical protein
MCEVDDEQPIEQATHVAKTQLIRAREQAVRLFPLETWREIEERIFIAAGREPRVKNQQQVLEKELAQARILTAHGSAVYLLPEITDPARDGVKHPDAVVDGYLMEFKTITGSINQIGHRFRDARKKADQVFLKIDSALSPDDVRRTLAHIVTQSGYTNGLIIVYFNETGHIQYWDIQDLR